MADLKPIPMALLCPTCKTRHIDQGEWSTRLHKTHLCATCGKEWRPFEYPTVGVAALTREEVETARPAAARRAQILFGDGAIVGYNPQYPDKPCFVGKRIRGAFVQFGAGDSWDVAFAAVCDVIDLGNGRFRAK